MATIWRHRHRNIGIGYVTIDITRWWRLVEWIRYTSHRQKCYCKLISNILTQKVARTVNKNLFFTWMTGTKRRTTQYWKRRGFWAAYWQCLWIGCHASWANVKNVTCFSSMGNYFAWKKSGCFGGIVILLTFHVSWLDCAGGRTIFFCTKFSKIEI